MKHHRIEAEKGGQIWSRPRRGITGWV